MHRWAVRDHDTKTVPSQGWKMHVKRCLIRPFHVALIVIGLALLVSATQIHAYPSSSNSIPVVLSTHELFLQQGSELPIQVSVQTLYGKNAQISFDAAYPTETLRVDGELNPISTSFPIQRDMHIAARASALPGDYRVILTTTINVDGQSFWDVQIILVHVQPKGFVTYFTSVNSTFSPAITNVVFSTQAISLPRNEKDSFTLSFVNQGSATDYLIRLSEPAIGISARVVDGVHRFVQPGETVHALIEIETSPTSPFESFPLRLEAYNFVSGEKTFLGSIVVNVEKVSNIEASVPFHSFTIEENDSVYSSITLQNTEYNDVDVILESSSTFVEIQSRHVHVPSKSSVSIPILIHGSSFFDSRAEQIFVVSPIINEQVSFIVNTVKKGSLHPVLDVNASAENTNTFPTGLVSGALSPLLGLIIITLAILLIFSSRARNWVKEKLPKGKPVEDKK